MLRSFHNPIAIRIEQHQDTYLLHWKLSDGAGGYEPGKLVLDKEKIIDKATWDNFKTKITEIDFWNLPTNEKRFGNDGAEWILEGKQDRQYHVVQRWSPSEHSAYFQCCNFLLDLIDIKIKKDDKY